jgi:hypothetical protein
MERRAEGDLPESAGQGSIGISSPGEEKLSWTSLFRRTYSLYGIRFWPFCRMAFLPALLAFLFSQAWGMWVRRFLMHLIYLLKPTPSRFPIDSFDKPLNPPWYEYFLNAANALSFVEGAIYWLLSAFLFAAVATYVLADETNPRPLADAYTVARERIGPIFGVGLLSWTCFMVSRIVGRFAALGIINRLHLGAVSSTVLFVLPSVLLCGLLSRLGLAIPWLIDHPADSFSSAIRNSVRKTEDWEPFFMLFVIKSGIAAFVLFWLAGRGISWLWNRGIVTSGLLHWRLNWLAYICIATALETPLFIALSILHREKSITREESLPAAVG